MTITSTLQYCRNEDFVISGDDPNQNFDKSSERNVNVSSFNNPQNSYSSPTLPPLEITNQNLFNTNFLEPLRQRKLMSSSGILSTLNLLRDPLVEYQSTRGISRNENITFMNLLSSLVTQAYTAALTILVMLWNLIPLVEGILYFVRFVLDKLIDIVQTEDHKDKAVKTVIFCGELFVILIIIFLIVGLIFMPVYVLTAKLFGKLWTMIIW